MKKNILVAIAAVLFTMSCSKSGSTTDNGNNGGGSGGGSVNCTGVPASFSNNVNPIIQSTCATNAGCHGPGSANGPGELLTYNQISSAKVTIKTVVANGTMPKNGSLTTAQKNSIICWIDSGAPNN